jgi:hypothetical protein
MIAVAHSASPDAALDGELAGLLDRGLRRQDSERIACIDHGASALTLHFDGSAGIDAAVEQAANIGWQMGETV